MTSSIILISLLAIWLSPTKNMIEAMNNLQFARQGSGFQVPTQYDPRLQFQNPSVPVSPYIQGLPPSQGLAPHQISFNQGLPSSQGMYNNQPGFPQTSGYTNNGFGYQQQSHPYYNPSASQRQQTQLLNGEANAAIPMEIKTSSDNLINKFTIMLNFLEPQLKKIVGHLQIVDDKVINFFTTTIHPVDRAKVAWIILKKIEKQEDVFITLQQLHNNAEVKDNEINIGLDSSPLPTYAELQETLQNIIRINGSPFGSLAQEMLNNLGRINGYSTAPDL
ncbi:uncharacterized protein LOC142332256 isoform X1 [Lycorma delicatula]|uniref:uncharacterized protein LOC142332256 isoform X1 n=1 Tax=Lycorma delicatula TaxID=130591 RepID=UPI003F512485